MYMTLYVLSQVTVSDITYKQLRGKIPAAEIIQNVLNDIYPSKQSMLASFNATLVSATIDQLRKLQEQSHWKKAIANVVSTRINAIREPLAQLETLFAGAIPEGVSMELESSSETLSMTCVKLQQLCCDVCPALLIVGGFDAYFSLSRHCTLPQSAVAEIGFSPKNAFIDSTSDTGIDMKYFNPKTKKEEM